MKLTSPSKQHCPYPFFVPFIVLLMFSGLLGGCITGQTKVPKVSQDNAGLQLTGKFIWYDIFTADISGTAKFYSELFGWSFENVQGSQSQIQTIFSDGLPIGNAIGMEKELKEESSGQWLGYISIPDVDVAVQMLENNQGTLHTAARDLPNRGRVAVVRDPQGALFAFIHSSAGDPPDGELKHSSWLGSELWTTDIEDAQSFYSKVAGYEELLVPLSCGDTYHFMMRDGKPRAGIAKIPWDDVQPNWIPYIVVEDVVAITHKAIALGATLIMEPDSAFPDNEVAILADPSGAVFGIQQVDLTLYPEGK